jgi:pimeloyl-ACP methyl ester carboxylesterase
LPVEPERLTPAPNGALVSLCGDEIVTRVLTDYGVDFAAVSLAVRELGTPDGRPVLHFHGTPGSRLELDWGEEEIRRAGVRLVTFDRPGYGRSSAAPFSLTSVAKLAVELMDELGIGEFVTSGWSGGGPFALATATVAPTRVLAVGVMAGAAPFQLVPGELDRLSGGDAEAASHLKTDPVAAAELFRRTFEPLGGLTDLESVLAVFGEALSERDTWVLRQQQIGEAVLANLHEASLQRFAGGGWDNVAWVGDWDFNLSDVRSPVRLWYGDKDAMAVPETGAWLQANLPDATLTIFPGYGHLALIEHLTEVLDELLRCSED